MLGGKLGCGAPQKLISTDEDTTAITQVIICTFRAHSANENEATDIKLHLLSADCTVLNTSLLVTALQTRAKQVSKRMHVMGIESCRYRLSFKE